MWNNCSFYNFPYFDGDYVRKCFELKRNYNFVEMITEENKQIFFIAHRATNNQAAIQFKTIQANTPLIYRTLFPCLLKFIVLLLIILRQSSTKSRSPDHKVSTNVPTAAVPNEKDTMCTTPLLIFHDNKLDVPLSSVHKDVKLIPIQCSAPYSGRFNFSRPTTTRSIT